jgi:hypothetical protein
MPTPRFYFTTLVLVHVLTMLAVYGEQPQQPPEFTTDIQEALVALEDNSTPHLIRGNDDDPESPFYLGHPWEAFCYHVVEKMRLERTKADISKSLMNLLKHKDSSTRWHALDLLADRRHPDAPKFAVEMALQKDIRSRFIAIKTLEKLAKKGDLPALPEAAACVAVFEKETNDHMQNAWLELFQNVKVPEATEILLARVKNGVKPCTALALAKMGNPEHAAAMLAAYKAEADDELLTALGVLATPEAIKFLEQYAQHEAALDALVKLRTPRAIELVKKKLVAVAVDPAAAEYDVVKLRVQAIGLESADEVNTMLELMANNNSAISMRHQAAKRLIELHPQGKEKRIFEVLRHRRMLAYTHDDLTHYAFCAALVKLLKHWDAPEFTSELKDMVNEVKFGMLAAKTSLDETLLNTLNRRLDTYLTSFEDLKRFLNPPEPAIEKKNPPEENG